MRTHIIGARLIDPASGTDQVTDLFLQAGKVTAIGQAPAGFEAETRIDAQGLVAAPGLVDLNAALREPGRYRSVSAFSPISHPSRCPWGQKALGAYLGNNPLLWQEWDACQLLRNESVKPLPTLVDVGLDDPFLAEQLHIDALADVAASKEWPLELNRHPGYDHSYYFVASFIEAHLRFHARHL